MLRAVLVLLPWVLAAGSAVDRPAVTDVDVQGHRGCRGRLPENSVAGFERALELGVTTLELDLQSTRDRVLVVYHDQRLDPKRCVRDGGFPLEPLLLKELSFDQLAEIDCGSLRHPDFPSQRRVPGSRIPRLEQVLALARDAAYPAGLNLEIKMQKVEEGIPVDEFARLLVDQVKAHGLAERVTIQSFHPPALLAVRDLDPKIPRAILVARRKHYDERFNESEPGIFSPRYQGLKRADVERFQSLGIPVMVWTVNKPAHIRRMLDWGVDGIISDYPDRVIEIIRARTRESDGGSRDPG